MADRKWPGHTHTHTNHTYRILTHTQTHPHPHTHTHNQTHTQTTHTGHTHTHNVYHTPSHTTKAPPPKKNKMVGNWDKSELSAEIENQTFRRLVLFSLIKFNLPDSIILKSYLPRAMKPP